MATTFGDEIRKARLEKGLSLKQVADQVRKEPATAKGDDRGGISPQYLNDLELGRRNPPSEHFIEQLADALELSRDYLIFLAGQLPSDVLGGEHRRERVEAAFQAFRKELKKR